MLQRNSASATGIAALEAEVGRLREVAAERVSSDIEE